MKSLGPDDTYLLLVLLQMTKNVITIIAEF